MKVELVTKIGYLKIYFVNDSKYVVCNGDIEKDYKHDTYFKDNVLFESTKIQDVIEFYNKRKQAVENEK